MVDQTESHDVRILRCAACRRRPGAPRFDARGIPEFGPLAHAQLVMSTALSY
uniref:Uncharacterized protein n=1 Tax=uncultured organism TaxID=155900 RepID=A0A0G3VRY5_9ZZZZ|nr:hypothetical protein [uncultured organism]